MSPLEIRPCPQINSFPQVPVSRFPDKIDEETKYRCTKQAGEP